MSPKEYQTILKAGLQNIYPNSEIEIEWPAFNGVKDIYSPRVDLAVGPFAYNTRHDNSYNSLLNDSRNFIEKLIEKHNENLSEFNLESDFNSFNDLLYFNSNARCLLCMEIENKVSRKHLIGGLINASALGRIGILIPWTPEKLKAFIKLKNYLKKLGELEKNTFRTDNILILTKEQLDSCF